MAFPEVAPETWRALVEKDLAGKSFDKTLVHEALAGVAIAPLYTEAPAVDDAARHVRKTPLRICMRHNEEAITSELVADVTEGADALWLPFPLASAIEHGEFAEATFVVDATEVPAPALISSIAGRLLPNARLVVGVDPIAWRVRGRAAPLAADLAALAQLAVETRELRVPTVLVSTEAYHDAGADAAEEIAIAVATGAAYLETLLAAGLEPTEAASAITLRVAVGRDTFVELCKLRALRVCFDKLLVASGAGGDVTTLVHAVCSAQTLSVRDPWVNMLRITTQTFAAIVGGADLVTPIAYDTAFGAESPLGRRLARNTALVLREESALGKVGDPAGGAYYFDTLTDTLARRAWARFQEITRSGGIASVIESGELAQTLDTAWRERFDRIAKRKVPVLGVSEFANLGETLPHPAPRTAVAPNGLPVHRDSAIFETLRLRADATSPEALLLTLGTFADSRPRAGFAASFLAAGGIRSRETTEIEAATVVCLCGTDERYAEEAVLRARTLKAAGVPCVLLAGRPGALESQLREAGVDGFLYVGCDAVALLAQILDRFDGERR